MKGVLSDKDMAMIRQASSRLSNQRIGDAAAYQELTNVINTVSQRLGGAGQSSEPMRQPIPGIPGAEAESLDGGKTWKRVK
jgi:hypothetical protein